MLVTTRLATVDDVDRIVDVLFASKAASQAALSDHDRDRAFWTARWRRYIEHGSTAQHATGGSETLIAEADGHAVAFVAYHRTRRHGVDAELQSIYVLGPSQRRGVGSSLLRQAAARLIEGGARSMCVGYGPENPFKQFYIKHGAIEIDPHWAVWNDLASLAEAAAQDA